MGRHSCCYKQKLRKGLWSPEEDEKLLRHITKYGHGCWSSVPKQAGTLSSSSVSVSLTLQISVNVQQPKRILHGSFLFSILIGQAFKGVGRAAD